MAFSYELDHPFLVWRVSGNQEMDNGLEMGLASLRAAQDSGQTGWHILCDLRESTEQRSNDDLRQIAQLIANNRLFLSGRMANVVGDALRYGKSRVLGVFMDDLGVALELFADEADARHWLETGEHLNEDDIDAAG